MNQWTYKYSHTYVHKYMCVCMCVSLKQYKKFVKFSRVLYNWSGIQELTPIERGSVESRGQKERERGEAARAQNEAGSSTRIRK